MKYLFILITFIVTHGNDIDRFDKALEEMKATQKTKEIIKVEPSKNLNSSYEKGVIFVESDSLNFVIDSLQNCINSYKKYGDKYYRELIGLKIADKIRYRNFLINKKVKSKTEVIAMYENLQKTLKMECCKLHIIMNCQIDNNRVIVNKHIRSKRRNLEMISTVISEMVYSIKPETIE